MKDITMRAKSDFTRKELLELAGRYKYEPNAPNVKPTEIGCLSQKDFSEIVMWKTKRPKKRYGDNSGADIEKITTLAFSQNISERLRIESLCLLDGVGYPVASAILHFGYRPDKYPIIDFRAIWSLGIEVKSKGYYTFDIWEKYCDECRKLSERVVGNTESSDTPIRIVDKALWQFSKDNDNA